MFEGIRHKTVAFFALALFVGAVGVFALSIRPAEPPVGRRDLGVVVNHHLLADDLITSALTAVDADPNLIVLVSPNHFQEGSGPFLTSALGGADAALLESVTASGRFTIDEAPFAKEHGITNLLPYLRSRFPGTPILPIIVKDIVPLSDAILAADELATLLPSNSFVVGSFDFSHYLPEAEALERDGRSRAALETMDPRAVSQVTVDSQPGLALTVEVARGLGATSFAFLARDSSVRRYPQAPASENTSYLTGLFVEGEI